MPDHYTILQVPRNASAEEIQRAYRSLALRYHPDRNSAPEAAVRMAAINEAYEVLGDRKRRLSYDVQRTQAAPNNELAAAVLLAAREVVLRSEWKVVVDPGPSPGPLGRPLPEGEVESLLLAKGKQRVRVFFVELLTSETARRLSRRRSMEPAAILAYAIDGTIQIPSGMVAIGLTRGERYGAALVEAPDGLFRPLLAAFL